MYKYKSQIQITVNINTQSIELQMITSKIINDVTNAIITKY